MMRFDRLVVPALAIALGALAASCSKPGQAPPPEAAVPAPAASAPRPPAAESFPLVSGLVVLTAESPHFTPCGQAAALHLADATGGDLGAAYEALADERTGEMWAQLRAHAEGDGMTARALVRAARTGGADAAAACAAASVPPGELRAGGASWSARVTAGGIEWREGGGDAVVFPPAEPVVEGARRSWSATLPGSPARSLALVVGPARCKTESGAWESLAAEAVLDQRAFQGCAADGS